MITKEERRRIAIEVFNKLSDNEKKAVQKYSGELAKTLLAYELVSTAIDECNKL